ncbi:MAG: FecR family protein [Rhizobiales bacterium]|nr:FecR family protein [Hyphomicrobiales bacterium]
MTARETTRTRQRRHRQAADWFLRNQEPGGKADATAFQAWLDGDPANRTAYQAAERMMGEARGAILADPGLRDFAMEPGGAKARPVILSMLAIGLAGGLFLLADGPMRLKADAMSGPGEMPVITLADGSTLQLNASSAVAYDFTGATRTVTLLRGQAFFQVARDIGRPFVVTAQGGRITALGTAFDVRLGAEATDVTVTEHAVSLAASGPAVRLEEGQRAAFRPDGTIGEIQPADMLAALAWRHGQLVVDNATVAEVVAEIGRHFRGRILIAGTALAERRVSGSFAIADTDAALSFLERSLGISAIRLGPLIVLRG